MGRTSPYSMMMMSCLPTGFRSSNERPDPGLGARCGRSWPSSPLSQSHGEMQTVTHRGGSTSIPFPDPFDLWKHMFENMSPFCGFAFPCSCFVDMGVRFDETLAVVEDWDVILQVALLCGVTDSAAVSSLYRRWQSPHSSFALHSADEWSRARDKVLARIDVLGYPPTTRCAQ